MQRPHSEAVTLADILITEELSRRVSRVPDLLSENQAMRTLIHQMAQDSETLLQSLVDTALELCRAGTTGVSLLETTPDGAEIFRWNALAGTLAHHVGGSTPRNFSPCGVCLDQGSPVLFSYPERYFTYFQEANTPVVEGLVLPLVANHHVFGTIWIMSHDEQRHFDLEDVRLMASLADFTATALVLQQRQTGELLAANVALEAEVVERKQAEEQTRALISNLPGGAAFVVDRDLRYFLAEGEALASAGFKPEDFIGRTIFEVLSPNLAAIYEPMYRQALAGEPFEHEHQAHEHTYISRGTPLRKENGAIDAVLVVSYDITDRKQAEASLRESEERLRDVLNSMAEGFALLGGDFTILDVNEETLRLDGRSRDELIGRSHWDAFPGTEDSSVGEIFRRVARERISASLEHLYRWPDGRSLWLDMRAYPMRNAGMAIFWRDVTDRKEAEAALRQSEEKYRTLFESMDEGVMMLELIFNDTGKVVDFIYLEHNAALSRQTGITNDIIGKHVKEIYPDLEAYWFKAYERVAKTGEPERHEYYFVTLDSWFDIYISRAEKSNTRKLVCVYNNITDRKLREQQQEFLLQLSDALRPLTDPIELQKVAMKLLVEQFNVMRATYFEVESDQDTFRLTARYEKDAVPIPDQMRLSDFALEMANAYRAGRTLVFRDTETETHLGSNPAAYRPIGIRAWAAVPLVKNGEILAIVGVHSTTPRNWTSVEVQLLEDVADRTWVSVERARAEVALRESELQRVREQSEREQERQRAETLAELDRSKTLFFSNISHEFRTPLTLSLAPLQDALSDRTHPLDPVHSERLELVHRNSLRLLKLVNTLLDFSRIEAGRMEAVYESTDLALFTTELSSVFRSAIKRAGLQLIVDCPPLSEPVFVDREMWEKIVLNLLSNAFKFTFEGAITVRLHPANGNQAILQIQDTGTGIAPKHLPHLFERFYQVRGTQARTHEGSGIGLALVNELVRLHGGTIEVSSILEEGTCFTVSLPFGTDHLPNDRLHFEGDRSPIRILSSTAMGTAAYVEETERWLPTDNNREQKTGDVEEQPAQTADSSLPTLASVRVLLVDDNADMQEYLSRILSKHVQVETVADGVTALAAAQARVPDLILSDLMMPGLDGFELLGALREDPRTREVPIILLSARAGVEAIVEGLEAGADDYLIKPFSAQELVSRVLAHLQMAHLRGETLQEARSTIRSRDEFISVVSHELNTPLVSIIGWTRLLRANSPSPKMLTKALNTIERNATLQAKLVQDLLDISRIAAGKLRLNTEPVELEAVIETAIATVTQMAQTKGIDLNWHKKNMAHQDAPNVNSIVVMGDRDRLGQVICNLLSNAIKFTPQSGSVTIELSVIEDDHSPNISCARICVTDTGIGIAADFLPHVFERFRQARNSDAAKGMGLGLAIARHLVELHNGTISAQSAGVGQGATFTVKLPLCLSQQCPSRVC